MTFTLQLKSWHECLIYKMKKLRKGWKQQNWKIKKLKNIKVKKTEKF